MTIRNTASALVFAASLALAGTCVFVAPVHMHAQLESGAINGTVSDPTGALIPNTTVTARNTQNGFERKTTTNSQGSFQFLSLINGPYEVSVAAPGFAPYKTTVTVAVGGGYDG